MTRDWLSFKHTAWTLALPLAGALLLLQATALPQRLDFWFYDSAINAYPVTLADDVVLVAIDERSLEHLGRWPWSRTTHGDLIRKLDQAGARTIVYDVLFPEPSVDDAELASALTAHGNVVLPMHLYSSADGGLMVEQLPAPPLLEAVAAIGHAHVELDADGLARGLYLLNGPGQKPWPSLAAAAAAASGSGSRLRQLPAAVTAAPYINVRQDYVVVPPPASAPAMPAYSFVDVLTAFASPGIFQGKTVFVGATATGLSDALPTPYSGLTDPMSGVEFHANVYSALVESSLIRPLKGFITWLLPLTVILFLTYLMPRLRPARTLMLCGGTLVAIALVFGILLIGMQLWLPVANALLVPLTAFPLWSARRLAMTNRFLNRQLDELGRGHQLHLPEPSQVNPMQLLEHLSMLLEAEGCWLSVDDEVLVARQLTRADQPAAMVAGHWTHVDSQSWLKFSRGQRIYHLGLMLPASLTREANRRYLQRLSLDVAPDKTNAHKSRENISVRIERVRLATEHLHSMQAFIGRSFEKMPDGIVVTDSLGIIQFVNGHIEEWFGEPRPSLIGMSLVRLLQGHDPRESPAWPETVADTLTLSQSQTVDLRVRGMDFLIHLAPFAMPESNQSGIIANISNISELREQQRQHREAIDFISHDVRSPLVSQLALIEQLKRRPGEIQPEQLDQLGRLARRSYQLAEEFVQLARAEQLTETRFYECEFLAIVENARDSVSEQAAEKGIRLQLLGNEDLWLNGNAELLERAVINLLTNAVQYSPGGSLIIIQAFQAGHQACLTISDEGNGIAQSEIPHLFDRFRRQKSSEVSRNYGAGLGLSFVSVVVEKHRGEINVVSEEGVGSEFTIKLPTINPV
ncbi:CHASE2 domain-containing protein [Marinobacter changyiensis]|uniref:CHASE2 domain-containing protein n=1 Tax=Marinobacter changyiensis TaxID=2604091 RepID=UPI001265A81A|nr:CHASE2 domain-containing protein [Marinobacter changyiensis]